MITYLACPYTHPNPVVKEERFKTANIVAARLMSEGFHIFSPISHTHPIALAGDLPGDWKFWEEYDRKFLAVCGQLFVLKLDGWRESTGVQNEIKIATELDLPIKYIFS